MGSPERKDELDAIKGIVADIDRDINTVYKNLSRKKKKAKKGVRKPAKRPVKTTAVHETGEECGCQYCVEIGAVVRYRKKIEGDSKSKLLERY